MANSKKMTEAINKAFDYLESLSKEDFMKLLEDHKDGIFTDVFEHSFKQNLEEYKL